MARDTGTAQVAADGIDSHCRPSTASVAGLEADRAQGELGWLSIELAQETPVA